MDLLRNIALVLFQFRHFHSVLAEFKSYSDRELSEWGIARSDITRRAYEEAEQHAAALARGRAQAPAPAWQNPALVPG